MNNSCLFYIIRHAKSEANKKDVISGQTETELSREGIRQARSRAKDLMSIHFDAAFSSDLSRAHHTAVIIAHEHDLEVVTVHALRERYYGSVEGKRYDELRGDVRKQFDAYNLMEYKERFFAKLVPGMESDEEVVSRFMGFLRKIASKYPGKTVLVVCHGNMMRTLLVHLGCGTHQEFSHGTAKNTSYFILKSDGVEFEVIETVGIEKKSI